jgi:hypothetical protein
MKRSVLMERVRFVPHGNKRILRFDFSGLGVGEAHEIMAYGSSLIAKMPGRSVLTLTNITGAHYDREVTEALKGFTRHNKPYVIAGAVVGVEGLKRFVFQAVTTVTGRTNLKLFGDEASAKDWLAGHAV